MAEFIQDLSGSQFAVTVVSITAVFAGLLLAIPSIA